MSDKNVSYFFRIFLGGFFGLCCAFFPVSVNASYVWDEVRSDFKHLKTDVDRNFRNMVSTSRGVVVTQEGKIVGSVAADNAMQFNSTVKYTGPKLSARSNSVLRYGSNTVKAGAAACLKAPVRCNLVGLGVGAGINALLDSIDAVIDGDKIIAPITTQTSAVDLGLYDPDAAAEYSFSEYFLPEVSNPFSVRWSSQYYSYRGGVPSGVISGGVLASVWSKSGTKGVYYEYCPSTNYPLIGFKRSNKQCQYGSTGEQFVPRYALPDSSIDSLSDNFVSTDSDLPTVGAVVLGSQPTTIDLEPTEPVKISDSKQFNEDGSYSERERSGRYAVSRSGTAAPRVEYVEKEVKKDFDDLGNEVGESSTEYRDYAQSPSDRPAVPVVDVDIPTGCALFDPFCHWAEWTQQDLGEEEPDLSSLMHDFEPENDEFTLTLGAASCPAPIDVELSIIGRSVELSYEPICDLVEFIRPLILASAYLFAAYLYLGVLRG